LKKNVEISLELRWSFLDGNLLGALLIRLCFSRGGCDRLKLQVGILDFQEEDRVETVVPGRKIKGMENGEWDILPSLPGSQAFLDIRFHLRGDENLSLAFLAGLLSRRTQSGQQADR
jgi:hypothetical protein